MRYVPERLAQLQAAYIPALTAAMAKNPADYIAGPADLIVGRMCDAIEARGIGAVNLGPALKSALRSLGVKPTYKAAEAWLLSEVPQ